MSGEHWNILVVEDNDGDFFLIGEYLSDSPVKATLTRSPTLGRAREAINNNKFDTILLDLSLPDATGKELITDMVSIAGSTPVIVLTGYSDRNFGLESLKLGVQDYLIKDEVNSTLLFKSINYSIERKRIVDDLLESNERYQLAERATNDMLWDWDLQAGSVYRSKEGWRKIFGSAYPEPENAGTFYRERVHPEDLEPLLNQIDSFLTTEGEKNFEAEFRARRDNGTYAWIVERGYLIRDKDGAPRRLIGATQDITTRKRQEIILTLEKKIYQLNASPDVTVQTILEELVRSMEYIIPDSLCSILKLHADNTITCLAGPSLPTAFNQALNGLSIGPNAGSCGAAMYTGTTVIVADIDNDPLWQPYLAIAQPHNLKACWSVPIKRRDGKVIGSFATYYRTVRHPEQDEIGLVQRAASLIGVMLENIYAAEEIARSHERYILVSKATSDMVWDWDLRTDTIYRSEEGWKKLFGEEYGEAQKASNAFVDRIHPEDREAAVRKVREIQESDNENTFETEFRVRRANGTYAYVMEKGYLIRDEAGKPYRLIGATQDITERKLSEIELENKERRFRQMVQSGSDLMAILDEKGIYCYVSPTVKKVLGHDADAMVGTSAFDFVHPADLQRIASSFGLIQHQAIVEFAPFRFRNAGGEWRWLESKITNFMKDPAVRGIVVNSRDITEKKAAAEELERLSLIARETVNSVVITDRQGKITWVNEAFTRITGYSFSEVQGKKPGHLLQGKDSQKEVIRYMHESIKAGAPFDCEIINYAKSGKRYWVKINGQPIRGDNGEITKFFALQTDITSLKEAEENLRQSEERFRALVQNAFDAVQILDGKGIATYVSPSIKNILGFDAEEVAGRSGFDFLHPDDVAVAKERLEQVLLNPARSRQVELRFKTKNDGYIVANVMSKNMMDNPAVRGVVVNFHDITSRKKAEEAIRNSEQRFRKLIENSADGLSIISADRNVTELSPAGQRILGFPGVMEFGEEDIIHVHPNDRELVLNAFEEVIANPAQPRKAEFRWKKPDNEQIWIEAVFYNQLNEPAIKAVVLNFRDITERKNQEKEKELLIQELTQNNQDLKQFSFITSHNLRAPVSNLMGILDLFDTSEIKNADNLKLIEGLRVSTNQLNNIINDLVNILIIKQNVNVGLEWLPLEDTWQKVRAMAQGLINEAEPEFNVSLPHTVHFHVSYLESILLNLLTNAIKYRSPNRKLKIDVQSREEADYIVLNFSDNGLGINTNKYEDRIFSLYQRFHTHTEGKGLGLYMVQSQLNALGGKIAVESQEDKGTCFTVFFKKEEYRA